VGWRRRAGGPRGVGPSFLQEREDKASTLDAFMAAYPNRTLIHMGVSGGSRSMIAPGRRCQCLAPICPRTQSRVPAG